MKVPFEVFQAVSVALQFTVVVPRGNILPEEGEQLTAGLAGNESVDEVKNVTTRPDDDVASCPVISAGRVSTGPVVSGV